VAYLVEYDDAIFHRYDHHHNTWVRRFFAEKIPNLMRGARAVIAGNDYIAVRAEVAGARKIVQVPTAIDLSRYFMEDRENSVFTVGWIGSPITASYLELIEPALRRLASTGPLKFVVIGAEAPQWPGVEAVSIPWTEASEVAQINSFDVGVMPLPDEPWERGKCGYKLIQYMACAKPVVASPVGANCVIVETGVEGFLATTPEDWFTSLEQLRDNKTMCINMGKRGREKVERDYCTAVTAPRLLAAIREAVAS